ncbi:MAG: asparaginase, partial [Gemmatimonadota bacterium]|nr:asparaginase [Gemmatimonadota bacterium]
MGEYGNHNDPPATDPTGVRVWRGEEIESRHRVHAALVRDGRLVGSHGDPSTRAYLRSSAKPIQLLPLVEEGLVEEFGFTARELAVMAASHNAESFHVDAARSILEKAGLEESHLQCGPHAPAHEPSAHALIEAGLEPTAIHNNCSGKHAGMLAVCVTKGWPLDSYLEPDHPLQVRIRETLAELAGIDAGEIGLGIDGCGVPCFALSVTGMATAFDSMAQSDAARDDDRARAIGTVVDAMAIHPEYVAGTGRPCTTIMAKVGERVVVKTGAEGVYGAVLRAAPDTSPAGLALKVADGARRAQDVAIATLLADLGVLEPDLDEAIADLVTPAVTNRAEAVVGRVDARLPLE